MNWQGIETAPKDGSAILVFTEDNREAPQVACWLPPGWMDWSNGNDCGHPTHWMPIPEPPRP